MKFPICKVCLKNNILCNACAERVGENEIKIEEIKIFRRLNKFLKDKKPLRDIKIKRAVGRNMLMIITNKEGVSKLIGKDGSTVKKLAKELSRPIRIVEQESNIKNFVRDIFFTVPIMGINIVYSPEGEKYKIRIPRSERTKLPVSSDIFASVSRSLFHVDADVVFE